MSRNSAAAPRKDPKTGTWFFVVDVGPGADGKRRQVLRRGFATKKQAQEELDGLRNQGRMNSYIALAKLTVKEYLEHWVAGLPASGLRPTMDGYTRKYGLRDPHPRPSTPRQPHTTRLRPVLLAAARFRSPAEARSAVEADGVLHPLGAAPGPVGRGQEGSSLPQCGRQRHRPVR